MNDFWTYWYFHIPNYVLAAAMYTLLGRLVLGFLVPADWDNYIFRAFERFTDPIVHQVRVVTPSVLGLPLVILFAVLWIMLIRLAFLVTLMNAGLAPGQPGS